MQAALAAGMALGLSVALPFGPVSLMCVRRSLIAGRWAGVLTGAGAACSHGIYAALAVNGARTLAEWLVLWQNPIHLASAAILVGLGLRTLIRSRSAAVSESSGSGGAFVSGLLLALSNPITVLSYAAIASSMSMAEAGELTLASWSALGAMAGAGSYYAALSIGTALFGRVLPPALFRHLALVSGSMLIVFGVMSGLR